MDYIVEIQARGPKGNGIGPNTVNRYRNWYTATNTTFTAIAEVKLLACSNYGFLKRLWCRISDPFQYLRAVMTRRVTKFLLKRVVTARIKDVKVSFDSIERSRLIQVGAPGIEQPLNLLAMKLIERKSKTDMEFHHWMQDQLSYLGYSGANEIIKDHFDQFTRCNNK
jgi:hypothetical protein